MKAKIEFYFNEDIEKSIKSILEWEGYASIEDFKAVVVEK